MRYASIVAAAADAPVRLCPLPVVWLNAIGPPSRSSLLCPRYCQTPPAPR